MGRLISVLILLFLAKIHPLLPVMILVLIYFPERWMDKFLGATDKFFELQKLKSLPKDERRKILRIMAQKLRLRKELAEGICNIERANKIYKLSKEIKALG